MKSVLSWCASSQDSTAPEKLLSYSLFKRLPESCFVGRFRILPSTKGLQLS